MIHIEQAVETLLDGETTVKELLEIVVMLPPKGHPEPARKKTRYSAWDNSSAARLDSMSSPIVTSHASDSSDRVKTALRSSSKALSWRWQ